MMPERAVPLGDYESDPLRCGVAELKAGNKASAREFLKKACKRDPSNTAVWLWRASAAETPLEAVSHLEQVLRINPKNATALAWISTIRDSATEPQAKIAARPKGWICRFCDHTAETGFRKCPTCRAVQDLDLDAMLGNEGLDERRLHAAIERRLASPGHESSFDAQYSLAVAWLNLFHSSEALQCLARACRLRPDDASLQSTMAALAARRLVMVVDDSATMRTVTTRTLERAGFRVLESKTGMEALSHLDEHTPDFVLLDVNLPVIDGYQVCKAIKGHPKTRRVPVVMLSGNDGFFEKVKGRMAGAEACLTKPCEPAVLLRAIREFLR